ncbi:hypothetical protein FSARC_13932 [Fusarium sarcochroum]|uniref:Dynamin N-terminal domain-containing protein n=1 Tax=Fusarium sarcochroum TaxID=1208366 RepID=A0A8H4SXF8_9HYPO|nr:hypothetical protein FSARC_13932 [Fusarium sarcochroum]
MSAASLNLVSASLLDQIDSLFACNVEHYIGLPHLVVVGQQSSGKNSVLEGLTSLPFPQDGGLCARFATQITFRRVDDIKTSALIIPERDISDEYQRRIRDWVSQDLVDREAASFTRTMAQVPVTGMMGAGAQQDSIVSAFSNDMLVPEILGPTQEHFSAIDLPETFKRTTQGLTTKEGISLVDNIVKS